MITLYNPAQTLEKKLRVFQRLSLLLVFCFALICCFFFSRVLKTCCKKEAHVCGCPVPGTVQGQLGGDKNYI